MNNELEQLKDCASQNDLRSALHSICSRFGLIVRLDILMASQGGKRQALCFLRLESGEQERQLMSELGVGRFGGDIVVIVDLLPQKMTPTALTSPPLRSGLVHGPAYHSR